MIKKGIICLFMILVFIHNVFARAPLYYGFPVYPPEGLIKFVKTKPKTFVLVYYPKAPTFIFEGTPFTDPKWEDWAQENKRFLEETNEVENYIIFNTRSLGWELVKKEIYRDGGSKHWIFLKGKSAMLVTIWCGGGPKRGTISYAYKEY